MHATMVTFTFEVMDPGTMARLQRERAGPYDAMPGLVSKTSGSMLRRVLPLGSSEAANALFTPEWRTRVLAVYGVGAMEVRPLEVTSGSDG